MSKRRNTNRKRLTRAELQVSHLLSGYRYFLGGTMSVLDKIHKATGIRTGRAQLAAMEVKDAISRYQKEMKRHA